MRLFSISILLLIGFVSLFVGCSVQADKLEVAPIPNAGSLGTRKNGGDWPRMLGSAYDSRSSETGILKEWPQEGLKIVWTADTGMGYGNGVSAHGRWFQFDRFGKVERLSCMNAETGELLWKWDSPVDYRDEYGYNDGPRCSPVVEGDRVFVYGVAGTLACLSAKEGKLIWKLDTNQTYGVTKNFFGVGASPLIYKDKLIAMVGGQRASKPNGTAMVAFDKETGKELYRIGNYLASYSAPVVHSIHGQDVCLSLVREGLLAFDPNDGSKERFFPWRAAMFESVNAASPIVWQNRVLISEAYEIGSALLSLTDESIEPIWIDEPGIKNRLIRAHWSTPLLDGNLLYASSGRNQPDTDLRCLLLDQASVGSPSWKPEVRWTKRNHDRMTGLIVDGHVLLLGEEGSLQLHEINKDKWTVLAQMELGETKDPRDGKPLLRSPSWAPPVLSHGLLYLRGEGKVVCLELIPQ